jgi:trk/ktr system potassium uptake protein
VLVTALLLGAGTYESLGEALRYAAFQVPCLMTTTGFATANFDTWPTTTKVILLTLMFVGGSAGSTGGGIKVMRLIILAKAARGHLERIYSPRTVRKQRVGHNVLDDTLITSTLVFFFLWIGIFVLGTFAVGLIEGPGLGLVTNVTAVIATLNNIGPGLARVGAVENYAFFEPWTKLLLTFFMVLGRLELYTILVLFVPRFWRTT